MQDDNDSGWWRFINLCASIDSPEKIDEIFHLFLTFEEREDLAARLMIIKSLLNGKLTQREMAQELKVSIAKITRGSNGLKTIDSDFRNYLTKKLV